MEPFIRTGSVVIVRPEETYSIGDVITFGADTKSKIPTTHRVNSIREEGGTTYFATKGDANEDPDPEETPQHAVIGKVLFSVPSAGFVLDFARQPLGFALLIGLPATLIVIDEAMRIGRELIAMSERKRRKMHIMSAERIRPRV